MLLSDLDLYIVKDLVAWLVVGWLISGQKGLLSANTESDFLNSEKIGDVFKEPQIMGAFNLKSIGCQSLCNIPKKVGSQSRNTSVCYFAETDF